MSTEKVAVVDGLVALGDDGPALHGTRCGGCGTHYVPAAVSCRNPACTDKRPEPALLGRRGVLYSWTVQHYQPPPLFAVDDWEPYALGVVEVEEGVRVLAILTGCEHDALEIGMALRLTTVRLRTDEEGREVHTHAFAPLGDRPDEQAEQAGAA